MVLAAPQSLEVSSVEQWFHVQAVSLKLLAPWPTLSKAQEVLRQHLPERMQRLARNIPDPQEASSWLQIVLKSGELIRLWPTPDQSVTVASNCSGNLKLAQEQLGLIRSPEFRAARKALGIDKHWFLVVPGYPLQVPKCGELLDALYAQLSSEDDCGIVQLGTN
jgi:hypothetical protein